MEFTPDTFHFTSCFNVDSQKPVEGLGSLLTIQETEAGEGRGPVLGLE